MVKDNRCPAGRSSVFTSARRPSRRPRSRPPEEIARFLGAVLDATKADITAAHMAKADGQRREDLATVYRLLHALSTKRRVSHTVTNIAIDATVSSAIQNPNPLPYCDPVHDLHRDFDPRQPAEAAGED